MHTELGGSLVWAIASSAMSLSPTTAVATASRIIGHRRGRSSGIDIRISDGGEVQEKEVTQSLLPHRDDERGEDPLPLRRGRGSKVLGVAWVLSLIATSFTTYALSRPDSHSPLGSFELGYTTELRSFPHIPQLRRTSTILTPTAGAAHAAITLQQTPFTGSLDFAGHHGFVPPNSPSLAYMGSGSAIDAAWETLTADRYFLLTDAEALEAYGTAHMPKYWNVHHGGYVAGLDVLHSLHCLNHLRMSLYPEVYPQDPVDGGMQYVSVSFLILTTLLPIISSLNFT